MKLHVIFLFLISFVSISFCQSGLSKSDLKSDKDKFSYCIGVNIGKHYKTQPNASAEAQGHADVVRKMMDVDSVLLAYGLNDGLSTDSTRQTLFTDEEVNQVLTEYQKQLTAKQKAIGEKNRAEGEKFLAENKKKEGVITLPSGLQYKVIKQGNGKSPKAEDTVTAHYSGTLINGTKFDSSYDRNEPIKFPVTGVIKGWVEALQLMKEGDVWELYIPSELAYGETGASDEIGPNTVLLFTVELIKVN